ncbi:MAG: MBL fold metallo-hydrolase [Vicinamibacterales bacterium]
MMHAALRTLAALFGLLFLVLGVTLLLTPGRQAAMFAVVPAGIMGLSTIRADLAGLFLVMGSCALLGAVRGSVTLLAVPSGILTVVTAGRLVGLIADGVTPDALRSLAVEIVGALVLGSASLAVRRGAPLRRAALLVLPALVVILLGAAFAFQRPLGDVLVRRFIDQGMSNQLVTTVPDGLHVGLCGSGSPMPDATRSGPCVLVIAGRQAFVVDVGEGGPRKLALMGVQPALIQGVLLTHFHSDHIGGLGELLLQRWTTGSHTDKMPVYGPQGVERVVDGFNLAYQLDSGYRVAHHGDATVPPSGAGGEAHPFTIVEGSDASQVVLQRDGLTITAFPVNHTPIFPAVGYRFDYGGRSVVISGDTAPSPSLVKAARGVDVLFHEGLQVTMVAAMNEAAQAHGRTAMAKITHDIPSYHTTPEDAAREAAEAGVRALVFYHTIPPLPVSFLNGVFLGDARKAYSGPITVSTDGLLVTLTSGTSTITQRNLL